ncbi:MAG: amidohydrolase, partial [Chitinophagaceae bacterium]
MNQLSRFIIFLWCFSSFSSLLHAQNNLNEIASDKSDAIKDKVIAWRRHIHENPELGNREYK